MLDYFLNSIFYVPFQFVNNLDSISSIGCRFIHFGISNENSHFFYIALIAIIIRKIVEWIDSETLGKLSYLIK